MNCKSLYLLICITLFYSSLFATDKTETVGHRGVMSQAPENTLASFRLALDMDVDYLEMDLYLSKDDSIMVIHDATVNKTTNGSGLVNSLTYAQLRDLDAGSKFSSIYKGEKIPTLYEVLMLAKGKKPCMVELKQTGIERPVVALIQKLNMQDQIILASLRMNEIQTVKQLDSRIRVSYVTYAATKNDIDVLSSFKGESFASGDLPSIENIEYARSKGIVYYNWTVNDGDRMLLLMSKGVQGIITNTPHNMAGIENYIGTGLGGLVCYYDFNATTNNTLADYSGNNNTGQLFSGTLDNGYKNKSLKINSSSTSFSIPSSPTLVLNGTSMSLSTWIKLDKLPSSITTDTSVIINSSSKSFTLFLNKVNQSISFKLNDQHMDTETVSIPQSLFTANTWLHITAVYNGIDVMIYLNGKLIDYKTNLALDNLSASNSINAGINFSGSIDELKIYNRALTPQEAKWLKDDFSIICNNTPTNKTIDITNEPYALKDTSVCHTSSVTLTPKAPKAIFVFDGLKDFINISNSASELANSSHSFFAWINTESTKTYQSLLSISTNLVSTSNGFVLNIVNGKLTILKNNSYTGTSIINDSKWHYVGYTWDKTTNTLKLWVDGIEEATFNINLNITTSDIAVLGQTFQNYNTSNHYKGKISEISIWSKALTSNEITNNQFTAPQQTSNLIAYFNSEAICSTTLFNNTAYNNNGYTCSAVNVQYNIIPNFNNQYTSTWQSTVNQTENTTTLTRSTPKDEQVTLTLLGNNGVSFINNFEIMANLIDTVLQNNSILFATTDNATYKWINCSSNEIISDETSQFFSPSVDGVYAANITKDNCVATTNCVNYLISGLTDSQIASITAYPNPTKDYFTLTLEQNITKATIEITDINAQLLQTRAIDSNETELLLDYPAGSYFITVITPDNRNTIKIIKI